MLLLALSACTEGESRNQTSSVSGSVTDAEGGSYALESGIAFDNLADGRPHVALASWAGAGCDLASWPDVGQKRWAFVEFEQEPNTAGYDNGQLWVGGEAGGQVDGWLQAEPDVTAASDQVSGSVSLAWEGAARGEISFTVPYCDTVDGFFASGL